MDRGGGIEVLNKSNEELRRGWRVETSSMGRRREKERGARV